MYVISDYYKASRDVIAFVAGYYEKLFLAELLDQKISIQKWDVCHPRVVPKRLNETRFSNSFIEKRVSSCLQSLEKPRLFFFIC